MSAHRDKPCTPSIEHARAAKPEAESVFSRMVRVAGIGITRIGKGYGLKINVADEVDANLDLPKQIAGVPVRVEVVGPIAKRAA